MENIMGAVSAFIAIAIMLGIGTLILGGSVADCSSIADYDGTRTNAATNQSDGTWANQCITNNGQAQAGYGLLQVSLIVLGAVVVLLVVRMLA